MQSDGDLKLPQAGTATSSAADLRMSKSRGIRHVHRSKFIDQWKRWVKLRRTTQGTHFRVAPNNGRSPSEENVLAFLVPLSRCEAI